MKKRLTDMNQYMTLYTDSFQMESLSNGLTDLNLMESLTGHDKYHWNKEIMPILAYETIRQFII